MQNAECTVQNGSGCASCPVSPCLTMIYRGAVCAAQRSKHGLGDPLTRADCICAMSDEELAKLLYNADSIGWCTNRPECYALLDTEEGVPEENCLQCLVEWLRQPAKENNNENNL